MQRALEHVVGRSNFHDPPEVHDGDPVTGVADHGEVMRDEQVRQAKVGLQGLHQVHNLCLDRDIQGRNGFVSDNQARACRERAGNADTLPLPPRELVRISICVPRLQADELEKLEDPRLSRRCRSNPVDIKWLSYDPAHRVARVQRGVRVLKDHLHLLASTAQIISRKSREIGASK
jgi:hypothetical protein